MLRIALCQIRGVDANLAVSFADAHAVLSLTGTVGLSPPVLRQGRVST
jgi:hypothetical protein